MQASPASRSSFKFWKTRTVALMLAGTMVLMFITNPTEKGFRKYLNEYISTESGASISPRDLPPAGIVFRTNYYIYSTYSVSIEGADHEFFGAFGSFHNYQ